MSKILFHHVFNSLSETTQSLINSGIDGIVNELLSLPNTVRDITNTLFFEKFNQHCFCLKENNILITFGTVNPKSFKITFEFKARINKFEFFHFIVSKFIFSLDDTQFMTEVFIYKKRMRKSHFIIDSNNAIFGSFSLLPVDHISFIFNSIEKKLTLDDILDSLQLNFDINNNEYLKTFLYTIISPTKIQK